MILDKLALTGRVALVTGGTKGIGKAIACAFAEAGADIAVASRSPDYETERIIQALGRHYKHYAVTLLDRHQTKALLPIILKGMGDLHILVNNAGVIRRSPADRYSEKDWDETLEIDFSAAFILSQAAAQHMLKRGTGKIINVASILAFQGGINVVAYASAKHGIAGLTKALANDWGPKGINVNGIAPSFFLTEMTRALQEDTERCETIAARTPIRCWGVPSDVAGAALFLASSASDFVHGVTLPVDGGWLGG